MVAPGACTGHPASCSSRSHAAEGGDVAAQVSHAWGDDFEQRYVALRAWAIQFELEHGRCPVLWLGALAPGSRFASGYLPQELGCSRTADKACINQFSIEESLKCLPIFLAHCERLVVLGGPLWPTRLWWCAPSPSPSPSVLAHPQWRTHLPNIAATWLA